MPAQRRSFGKIKRERSGRYQASYVDPGTGQRRTGPHTYENKTAAAAFLAQVQAAIVEDRYIAPVPAQRSAPDAVVTFGAFAETWLAHRDLRPKPREDYRRLLDRLILPAFGARPIEAISADDVDRWYAGIVGVKGQPVPTLRSHAYGLLRTIMGDAVDRDKIARNPCRIRGAGSVKRAKTINVATLPELLVMIEAMPPRLRAMLLLAAWCQLRFGELTELRRRDVDIKTGVLRVRLGVTRADGGVHVGEPKTVAGIRDVTMPPHIVPAIAGHLVEHTGARRDALLFPAADGVSHLAPSTFYGSFYPARDAAGRSDLTLHELRHTGATLSARAGATIAELMTRLGHTTPAAAMRYQHAARDRDREIADKLSELFGTAPTTTVVDLDGRRGRRRNA